MLLLPILAFVACFIVIFFCNFKIFASEGRGNINVTLCVVAKDAKMSFVFGSQPVLTLTWLVCMDIWNR